MRLELGLGSESPSEATSTGLHARVFFFPHEAGTNKYTDRRGACVPSNLTLFGSDLGCVGCWVSILSRCVRNAKVSAIRFFRALSCYRVCEVRSGQVRPPSGQVRPRLQSRSRSSMMVTDERRCITKKKGGREVQKGTEFECLTQEIFWLLGNFGRVCAVEKGWNKMNTNLNPSAASCRHVNSVSRAAWNEKPVLGLGFILSITRTWCCLCDYL